MKHPMRKYLRLARRYLPLVQGFVALVKLVVLLAGGAANYDV